MVNQDFREQFIAEHIKWMESSRHARGGSHSNADISVTECKATSKSGLRYNITFRNNSNEFFGQYANVAVFKNRMFFKPSSAEEGGYKLYEHAKKKGNPFLQVIKDSNTCCIGDFLGHHELKYDDFLDLYYIEREEDK